MMHARVVGLAEAMTPLPLPGSTQWPDGTWFDTLVDQPGVTIMIFAPRGRDHQTVHDRDETYVGARGHGTLEIDGTPHAFGAGQLAFVPKGVEHRFTAMSPDFSVWVIFTG